MAQSNEWYLRTNDETFGPEPKNRLIEWARMGRIQPGQEVSSDGDRWFPVTDAAFLDMRWSIDLGDGTPRGPFNKEAADALVRSGRLPKTARVVETRPPFPREALEEDADDVKEAESSASVPVSAPEPAEEGRAETSGQALQAEEPAAEPEPSAAAGPSESAAVPEPSAPVPAVEQTTPATDLVDSAELRKLRDRVARLEKANAELKALVAASAAEERESLAKAEAAHRAEAEKLEATHAAALEKAAAEQNAAIEAAEAKTAREAERAKKQRAEAKEALEAANARAETAAKKAVDAEAEFAELLSASNKRETEYQEKIAALGDELKRVPPDAAAAAASAGAIFELMQAEADDLAQALETEKREAEVARQAWTKRADRLLSRRQELLRRIGADVSDMTRRAVGDRPEDPQTIRLRQELDKLRQLHEASSLESDRKIREASERAHRIELENGRLRSQSVDSTTAARQIQELREKLQVREQELVGERQKAEAERQQQAASQQALLARLSSLETGPAPVQPSDIQAREAHSVKLPGWMHLKR